MKGVNFRQQCRVGKNIDRYNGLEYSVLLKLPFLIFSLGLFFGSAFSYIFNGFIMHSMNWRYVFHITGILTTLWSLIWYFIIYDNPEEHPRISQNELNLINKSIGDKLSKKPVSR